MQAIVLAGGKGERLWPLTATLPKAMIPILGKPILSYHLNWLRGEGVTDAVVACGDKSETIIEYCRENPVRNLRIRFLIEHELLGRGGATRKAAELLPLPNEPSIVSQGDTVSDMPLREAMESHRSSLAILTLMLVPYRSRFGVVEIGNDNFVTRFREKPRLPYWANAGTFIASPEFFAYLPTKGDEDSTIELLAREHRVISFRTSHYWRSIDLQKDISEAEADLRLPSLPHEESYDPSRPA
ncbi:MAG: nucleotidyltransferase family protein [Candidatus Liptonbacteria bacterium]|nr:nucleotidyltransferase family protein [Candidatus Liptonbacteria bacterium]